MFGWDDALALANTKAGAGFGEGLGKALGSTGAGPSSAFGQVDARGFFDGSGWTVSTGSSKASGGTVSKTNDGGGASGIAAPMQAGLGSGVGLVLGVVLLSVLLGRRS